MKCRYTFKVVSETALPQSLRFKDGVTEFTLVSNQGRLSAVIVEQAEVKFSQYPNITPPPQGGIARICIPSDPLLPFIQAELRAVRGSLAPWGVYNIETRNPKIEWIPENEIERQATDIFAFNHFNTPLGEGPPRTMPLDQIIRPLLSRRSLIPLETPLEFLRRGVEDLHVQRYIEAIYDFYFVLEYLFADGQFTKNGTRSAMLADPEVTRIIRESQANPLPDLRESQVDRDTFAKKYQGRTLEEVLNTIIELRGFLHHQSLTRKKNWSPGAPDEFKVDAYFLYAMAHSAVLNLSTTLLFTPTEDARFHATTIFTTSGQRVRWTPMPTPSEP